MDPIISGIISGFAQQFANELSDFLKDQSRCLFGFRNEFNKMKKTLDYMISFQADLEVNHKNYATVRNILADLRELIYEADDILLDCRIRLDYEEANKLHGHFISSFHCSNPHGLSFRVSSKILLNSINERFIELENKMKGLITSLPNEIGHTREEEISRSIKRNSNFRVQKPIGLCEAKEKIIGWIKGNEKSCRIGIVGMGGLGKTTIAREIFHAEDLLNYFSERIWVTVSQRVSESNIFLSIMKQLRIYDCEPDINVMLPRIRESLDNKNCLIVMDDVWDMDYDWWRQVFNDITRGDNCTKCLIITTRNENVLNNMGVPFTRIHRPKLLDKPKSLCLFGEVFSAYNNLSSNSEFRRVGEDIVKKCHGLPLAIKTIAGLLSTKPLSLQKWKDVCENFHDGLETVNMSLQLSYDDLSSRMKQCLLCFSIYPEDAEINAEQLVYWWVGEGIVYGSTQKTALEVGFQCLYELVNRCLVEVAHQRRYDGRVYQCKMHDIVRNLIIQKSKGETFGIFDEEGKNRPAEVARHFGYTDEKDEMLPEKSSKLRAFLLMKNCVFHFRQNIVTKLASVKSLRVLDLSHNEQDISAELLLRLIKSQKRLAYLNLHKIRGLEELPDWIRKRQNLQILVITECPDLKTLPPSITILKNLVALNVENCSLQYLPRGLSRLTKLQVLSGFKLACSSTDGARLDELIVLKELRELRISLKENDEIADDEAQALLKLDQLKVLSIDTKNCDRKQSVLVNKLLPPPSLRELFLRSYLGDTTPTWLSPSCLPELVYLYIDQSLYLRTVSQSFWDTNERRQPWRIEGLCFKHLSRFELAWDDVCSNMEHLSYVEVSHCYAFKDFPCDVSSWDSWEKPEFK